MRRPGLIYYLLTLGIILLGCYLLVTEIFDRWMGVITEYEEITRKEESFSKPEALAEEKALLLKRKAALASSLSRGENSFEPNQTGVVEYLNECSKEARVPIESLTPNELQSNDFIKEMGFKITGRGRYHELGRLLNAIETGQFLVRLRKVEFGKAAKGSDLIATIEGSAFLVPGSEMRK